MQPALPPLLPFSEARTLRPGPFLGLVAALLGSVAGGGCAGAPSAGSDSTLRVGTTGDHPPYSEAVHGSFVGIDIDLARDLAQSMNLRVEFVPATWPSLLSDLAQRRYDIAMSGIHMSEERKRVARFSLPYLAVGTQGLARCEDVERFPTLDDVNRSDVVVLSTLGGAVNRFVRENTPDATMRPVVGATATMERLAEGEGDITFGNSLRVHHAAGNDARLCVALRNEVYDVHSVGILVGRQSPHLTTINRWVEERTRDGVIEQVVTAHTHAR